MLEATSSRPHVNGILETSLYVERPTRSVEFYRRVFGFEPMDVDEKEGITDETRLCAMRAGDRSVLLLFKKGSTTDTDAMGAIHIAFGIARAELTAWEACGLQLHRVRIQEFCAGLAELRLKAELG